MSSTDPIFHEFHMRTTLCRHAAESVDDHARQAVKRGLKGMTVTCHCPLPDNTDPPDELDTCRDMMGETAAGWQGHLDICLGLESDFAPFPLPRPTKLHTSRPLAYIPGSVHPHVESFKKQYDTGDTPAYRRICHRRLAEAARPDCATACPIPSRPNTSSVRIGTSTASRPPTPAWN